MAAGEHKGFHPFEVTPVHLVYVGLGLFICIFSYLSLFIKERLYLGEAPIAAAFGIIVGPIAIDLFNPAAWMHEDGITPGGVATDEITLEIMRVTIALSVFAIGVELPRKYLLRHFKSIAILLGPVMAWGWLVTAGLIYALIPGLDFLNSLVVAACVSPTDPILAQAVVGGPWAEKHVPAHVRHMLMCESGCNDGAAFPFLYLALYLTQNREDTGYAIGKWFYETWAYEIILGTLLGALIGYAARKFMRFSERNKLIDRESFVAQYISLAIASMGVNVLLGSDDLLAAFACGTAFAWDGWFTKQTEDSNFSNIVDLLFNIATFIYIGALIPWHDFVDASIGLSIWRLIVLTICVLLTKRIPIILALWKFIPDIKTFREAIFCGHFGPMGVGAIFIATLGRTLMPHDIPDPPETSNDVLALTIQPIVYFFVLCSIIVHGFTIPFFAFGKNARRRAHTLTRTWSRNPSIRDDEPSWMSRVRRVKEGDDIVINTDDISAEKMSAQHLALIGRGAIGGYREDELRGQTRSEEDGKEEEREGGQSSSSSSQEIGEGGRGLVGFLNRSIERDLEKAEGYAVGQHLNEKVDAKDGDTSAEGRQRACKDMDGIEDWEADEEDFNPASDYLGDNCCEMRRYRERMQANREAKLASARAKRHSAEEAGRLGASREEEQDLGEAPMDRDIILGRVHSDEQDPAVPDDRQGQAHTSRARDSTSEKDSHNWPQLRSWVEGHNLVLEYQKGYSDDPEVQVIPLNEDERDSLEGSDTPAQDWVKRNHHELAAFFGHNDHASWDATESISKLLENKVHKWWPTKNKKHYVKAEQPKEETEQERNERMNLMFGAINWTGRGEEEGREGREGKEGMERRDRTQEESEMDAMAPVVFRAIHDDVSGGEGVRVGDSSVPVASTSAQDTEGERKMSNAAPSGSAPRLLQAASRRGSGVARRGNLRKKVLRGQIGLSGRRKSAASKEGSDEQVLDDDPAAEVGEQGYTTPRVMISEPASSSSSSKRMSPPSSFRNAGGNGKKREKFFPRSSSAGAGLAPSFRSEASNSPILKATAAPSSSRLGSSGAAGAEEKDMSRNSSVQWSDIADHPHDHLRRGGPINAAGADAFSRRSRTFNGSSSSGKELTRDARVYSLDDSDDEEADSDEESEGKRRHGGMGIRDGMSKIGAFFSNFTAPKGEGMGNPGPSSHPHLFPSHNGEKGSARRSPTQGSGLRREITRERGEEMESLSLPPASIASGKEKSGSRVMLDLPNEENPVSPGPPRSSTQP
ncbi:related to Na+/H+ antiporter AnNHA1 [Ustilago sp. UG-2017a]|nr:related to Na+/H+ antiporter AnNHA1 [Ustilago sp. UG-2017a]